MGKKIDYALATAWVLFLVALIVLPFLNWEGSDLYGGVVEGIIRIPFQLLREIVVGWSWPEQQLGYLSSHSPTDNPVDWRGYLMAAGVWLAATLVLYFVVSGAAMALLSRETTSPAPAGTPATSAPAAGGTGCGGNIINRAATNGWNFLIAILAAVVFLGLVAHADNFWDQYQERWGEQSQVNDAITAMEVTCGADTFQMPSLEHASTCLGVWKNWRDNDAVTAVAHQLDARLGGACQLFWNMGNKPQQELAKKMATEGVTGCPADLFTFVGQVPYGRWAAQSSMAEGGSLPGSILGWIPFLAIILGGALALTKLVRLAMGEPVRPVTIPVATIFLFMALFMGLTASFTIEHLRLV